MASLAALVVYRLSIILRRLNIILFRYEHVFGHQSWNIEFFARQHFFATGKKPLMIGFHRRPVIANKALNEHHKMCGVRLFSSDSLLTKLFRCGASYQKRVYGNQWHSVGYRAIATATMNELHTDVISEQQTSVAFPLIGNQQVRALNVLTELGLNRNQYCCVQDREAELRYASENVIEAGAIEESDFFDTMRQTTLNSLVEGVTELHKLGVTAVRMGAAPSRQADSRVILDYAFKHRKVNDDFSDIAVNLPNYHRCNWRISNISRCAVMFKDRFAVGINDCQNLELG